MSESLTLDMLDRCGNAACLDFVNTVHSRVEQDTHDYLGTYNDLIRWGRDGGLVSGREYRDLAKAAKTDPRSASRVLRQALELRELLYRIFSSVAREAKPTSGDVTAFNRRLSVLGRRRLQRTTTGIEWTWEENSQALDRPLWPVVLSAAELLSSPQLPRVKECPAPDGCGWLFLDTSKNGMRRWCNMRTCGNIAKARRYYRRHTKSDRKR
ncbi:MAG: hypothetical protein GTO29_14560 [Candidatus Latescibacteria bacterium]|nr:hypothetical protein [Candidatus Latescibacterota bacterium]NIO57371.1 hypothetical protein [Candidatus Latescibacterota bacterium]